MDPDKKVKVHDVPSNVKDSNEGEKEAKTQPQTPAKRRIVIETDGNTAQLIEANVAGNFELVAVLEAIAKVVKKS